MLLEPRLIDIQDFTTKEGTLNVVESGKEIPFLVNRVYWITKVDAGYARGAHAHKKLWQCFTSNSGSFKITLTHLEKRFEFTLNSHKKSLLVPPGYWRDLTDFSQDAVCSVLASDFYDESDYIRDPNEFSKWCKERSEVKSVPYLDFKRQYKDLGHSLVLAGQKVLSSGHYIMGKEVMTFEKHFAQFCDAKFCLGVSNGLEAIEIVLKAWGIETNDEVIVCANSFVATALAVSNVGATPVLVDNDPKTFNINPELIERAITKKTKAIALTHLYGLMADMPRILEIAHKHGLKILEDAAQAHGALIGNQGCSSLGDAATFSFYPTKNLGAFGDAGAIVTNDETLFKKCDSLRNYGATKKYHHDELGTNSRLDEIQASFLNIKLQKLTQWNSKRAELASIYLKDLSQIKGLTLPYIPNGYKHVWHVFAVLVKDGKREDLIKHLENHGVGYNIHYPVPIHMQKCYQNLKHKPQDFPVAFEQSKQLLSLPLDAYHTLDEIKYVSKVIADFFKVT